MASGTMSTDLQTEMVQYPSDGFTIAAFLARPQTPQPLPAVIVIQEWWGLNDHIKDIAQRLAREGFVAIAPDLYSRLGHKVTTDAAEAAKLMESLSSQAALRDLNATTKYLKQQPFVDRVRMGVVGFCMGGTFALMMTTHNSDIKAAVPFYGKVPPIETFRYQLCPILYHYGAKDGWVTKQEVDRLEQGLQQYSKPGIVYRYSEAGHAFFNNTRPEAYRVVDAKLAWDRTVQFLRRYLV